MSSAEAGVGRRSFAFVEYDPALLRYQDLNPDVKIRAKQSQGELVERLARLGITGLDSKKANMVFHPSGEVGLFFDPIFWL
jgi:hypothetical protein